MILRQFSDRRGSDFSVALGAHIHQCGTSEWKNESTEMQINAKQLLNSSCIRSLSHETSTHHLSSAL